MRLARFNIQSAAGGDKRYFVGCPALPLLEFRRPRCTRIRGDSRIIAKRFSLDRGSGSSHSHGEQDPLPQLQDARPPSPSSLYRLIFIAAAIVLVTTHPRFVLVALAYSYLMSAFVGMALTRIKHRGGRVPPTGSGEEGVSVSDLGPGSAGN